MNPSLLNIKKAVSVNRITLLCLSSLASMPLCADADKVTKPAVDLQAIYAQAFGSQTKMPSQLDVQLQIGSKDIAMIKAYSDDNKTITHIQSETFLSSIEPFIKPEFLQGLSDHIANEQRTPLSLLATKNITATFDQNSLSIVLSMPSEMRQPVMITLGRHRGKKQFPTSNELVKPATISGYTNFTANVEYNDETGKTKQRLGTKSVLNVKGMVLENQGTWRDDRENEWSRESTHLTIDQPEKLHRYTIGDVYTESSNFQRGVHLGGIRIQKSTKLNPYLDTRSSSQQSFYLEQDSEVKIYINDFLKDKKNLNAGEYRLTDLNFEVGANTVRLEIKDDEGNITEQEFSVLNNRGLLQSGLSTYALEIGKPAYRSEGAHHYDTDATIVSGHYQKGISNKLTADGSFITDGEDVQLGVTALVSTPIGGITGRVSAVKESEQETSYAGGVSYQHSGSSTKRKGVQLNISGDYFEDSFSPLTYSAHDDQLYSSQNNVIESRIHTSVGKALGKRLHADVNVQRETAHDKDDASYSASVNLRKSFKNGTSLSTRLRYQSDREKDKSVSVRLHVPLSKENKNSRYKTLDTSYNSIDESIVNNFFIGPKSNIGKDSLAASLTHYKRKGHDSVTANISYRGDAAEWGVSHSIRQSEGAGSRQHRTKLKLKTALAFADGNVAISTPITDSFAIVAGPDKQDKDIAVIRGRSSFRRSQGNELPDYYQSVIRKSGKSAVIGLTDYRYNTINVDSTALPKGSDPDATEFELKAAYKQGYILKAGGEPGVIVDGILLNASGEPITLEGGQLTSDSADRKSIPFFTNQAGRFRLISVPPGKYQIEVFNFDSVVKNVINIPNKVGKKYDAGEITISQ